MINRELIRIKIVQLTYAYYQNGNNNLENAEKELLFSMDKAYDLYHYLLTLIVEITKCARQRAEIETQRAEREETEAPSMRFAYNKFAMQLEGNRYLNEWKENQKTGWENDIEAVRRLLAEIMSSEMYIEYMAQDEDTTYEQDRDIWRRIYKTFIMNNDAIDQMLEDKSLYWNDDKTVIDTFVMKTIKRFEATSNSEQELLPQFKAADDIDFAEKLFRATILNAELYQRYMSESSRNWDFSRLAYMDVVIMQIAIAEMLTFPAIPVSVTINEYVELSKIYSTPKSWRYINGMLDNIARYLNESGKMFKPQRQERNEK